MSYHLLAYFAIFLPVVILIYQITPQKFRWMILLAADYVFFWMISGKLILYLLFATIMTHYIGLWLETAAQAGGSAKQVTKRKRKVLAFGILVNLTILIVLKYFNFFGENLSALSNMLSLGWEYKKIDFMVPIGISYYTLQTISYMTDVYRGTIPAEKNIVKIALYLSFFPQIMEGPISRFSETAEALWSGKRIEFENIKFGYQRIVYGLLKKIVIADRVAPVVIKVFKHYDTYDGSIVLFGAVCFTIQLYMEFSGCMDIIMGSGQIFGVTLPENFRQPFFAKDASDFWHRWHITLGTWFKDYIFYPVSLAKPVKNFAKKVKNRFGRGVSKFVAPFAALFCVWSCNGLWHGPHWTYIFYGMYYFVLIFLENILEEPVTKLTAKLKINREGKGYRIFRLIKLLVIVNLGEMFFRAETVGTGFAMLGRILTNFHITELGDHIYSLGMDRYDAAVALIGILIVLVVDILHEKNVQIRKAISGWALPARWVFWYAAIFIVIIFGAYGAGYTVVDMIYAGY